MVPMSGRLSTLFVVSETCKQSSRDDMWCLCQATCPRCLLFPKHVKQSSRDDRWCLCQATCPRCLLFPKHVKQSSRDNRWCLCQTTCPRCLLFPKHVKRSSREDGWCICQATCPGCFSYPKHENKAAGRTGGTCVKQLVLVVCFFRDTYKQSSREDRWCLCQATCPRCLIFPQHVNKAVGRTGGADVKQIVLIVLCF